jgi:hypothetical protein
MQDGASYERGMVGRCTPHAAQIEMMVIRSPLPRLGG